MPLQADEELATLAAEGDGDAFNRLALKYTEKLQIFCRHILRDQTTAEDCVQEALLRAHRNLASFDSSRRFSSWIYKIAQNVCFHHLRLKPSWDPLPLEVASAPLIRSEQLDRLEEAERELPDKYRAILFYKFRLEWTAAEIAEQMELSPEDVRVSLHRAIHRLREKVKP